MTPGSSLHRALAREALGLRPERLPVGLSDRLTSRPPSGIPVTPEEEEAWIELEYRVARGA